MLDQFADRDLIAGYALGHTATLVEQGLVGGKGDGIDPRGNLTRAEMAVILYNAITFTPAHRRARTRRPGEPDDPPSGTPLSRPSRGRRTWTPASTP